ncbi:hypothetical protein VTN02DRAFT_6417 [Thermoascus thermophilus]
MFLKMKGGSTAATSQVARVRPRSLVPSGRQRMNLFMFQFRHSSRECTGKHIAIMEQYKYLPQLLRAFHVELASLDQEWGEDIIWFVKQTAIDVRLC